ncbi:hypothetical protein BGZ76_008394 [Entomortierella beljakovae]|nr:hypothetical protein BGZ76_008394 [Entomortierella beljakovae]
MKNEFESNSTGNCSHLIPKHVEDLQEKLRLNFKKLSELEQELPQLIILYSELLSEISRVVPSIIGNWKSKKSNAALQHAETYKEIESRPESQRLSNILAIILSLKPDKYINAIFAEPFQIGRIDRRNLVKIQVENIATPLKDKVIVDDSWAYLQEKAKAPTSGQSTDDVRDHHIHMLADERSRLEILLNDVNISSNSQTRSIEVICVLDQTESELYGAPSGIKGKVIFVVSKDREDRPKTVTLNTPMHWIDRIFLKSGYSSGWINTNVIPLYVGLPDESDINLEAQRPESSYEGIKIRLSAKRPEEAYTRNKVRQGRGDDVLEKSVLEHIQKTHLFEMQAIRKPLFLQLMGSMSLDNKSGGTETTKTEISEESNPFL